LAIVIAGETPSPHMFRDVMLVTKFSRGRSGNARGGDAHAVRKNNATAGAARHIPRRIAFTLSIHLFYFAARPNQPFRIPAFIMDFSER
jgi:hypothetical protein